MTLEKPKPLNLPGFEPKQTLKSMLEDSGPPGTVYPSPLAQIDPMTLDILISRIDSGALALGQVPDPKDIDQLVNYYWSMADTFNREMELGLLDKPKKKSRAESVPAGTSVEDLLG